MFLVYTKDKIMRIYLESVFAPNLSEMPYCSECGLEEHPFAGDDRSWLKLGICRKCGYDCRSEFTQQLQEYVQELAPRCQKASR